MFDFIESIVLHAVEAWWMLWAVFLLCMVDGFFPVVPSESVLVALASIADRGDNTVALTPIFLCGWVGALTGDQIAYWMGRTIGVNRFRWMRTRSVRRAVGSARASLEHRGALVITTARYIPGGRVAVNFTAGATRYAWWKFSILDFVSAGLWSGYSILIGRFTSGWLDHTLLQIAIAVIFAVIIGWLIDWVLKRVMSRVVGSDTNSSSVDSQGD